MLRSSFLFKGKIPKIKGKDFKFNRSTFLKNILLLALYKNIGLKRFLKNILGRN